MSDKVPNTWFGLEIVSHLRECSRRSSALQRKTMKGSGHLRSGHIIWLNSAGKLLAWRCVENDGFDYRFMYVCCMGKLHSEVVIHIDIDIKFIYLWLHSRRGTTDGHLPTSTYRLKDRHASWIQTRKLHSYSSGGKFPVSVSRLFFDRPDPSLGFAH